MEAPDAPNAAVAAVRAYNANLNPIAVIPSTGSDTTRLSTTAVRRVNERSLQPAVFENVEETVIDLYSAVRNGYLQSRRRRVAEGRADSVCSHRDQPLAAPATEANP